MNKQEIMQKIKKAVEQDPLNEDIQRVALFGSHIHGNAKKDSDVDVLIEFTPTAKIGFFKFFDIQENMEKHLQKKVDLLTPEALSKFFRDKVLKEAEIIYER
ncbi:MAG: nucleotidyltransferase domain-containing protein [Candidatus Moraniibacteriota bacterium]